MSGSFDYRSFAKFANNFNRNANHAKVDRFMRQTLNYEGTELKSKVKERTPVGVYTDHWVEFTTKDGKHVKFWASAHGKQGGTLQKGWSKSRIEASGRTYKQKVYNTVYYAPHVEYGHKTVNGSFVPGQFFLHKTVEDTKSDMENRVRDKYDGFMRKVVLGNGK